MLGKIAIRNIPQQIWAALESLATEHDRSTEAEARHALRAWVEPSLIQHERSARLSEVSVRLRSLLEQVNEASSHTAIRPSHLAQAIGENYAEKVEDWFIGREEPSFSQLKATAEYLGANVAWLQHGDNHMFPVAIHRLSDDAAEAVIWLLNWDEAEPDTKVKSLHLVREASKTGSLLLIKELQNGHCKTFTTQYHVSDQIGAGGESALAHLWVTLELLYKRYTRGGGITHVDSYLLKPAEFKELYTGNTHPLTILCKEPKALWWEDIWDQNMYQKNEYWPGWRLLCESINRVVASRSNLVQERDKIRNGDHPFLKNGTLISISE